MRMALLVIHRQEAYEGQYLPEILSVADEGLLMDNPQWWEDEKAKQKADIDEPGVTWAEVVIEVPTEALFKALYPNKEVLEAKVVREI